MREMFLLVRHHEIMRIRLQVFEASFQSINLLRFIINQVQNQALHMPVLYEFYGLLDRNNRRAFDRLTAHFILPRPCETINVS